MIDKYTKLEEKIGEGKRRGEKIEVCFGDFLEFVSWEIVSVKNDASGTRINIVEVKCKTSTIRFVLNQKKSEVENRFGGEFLNNSGKREILSLRIR